VKLKHPHGGYLEGISIWSPTRQGNGGGAAVIGEVVTVKVRNSFETPFRLSSSPKT